MREYYWRNRDRILAKQHEYYQKNRERLRAESSASWERRREAFRELKIALGGKCSVCGEDDLDVLQTHHPDGGGEEGRRRFTTSRKFTNWMKYRNIPNIVLLCANCHQKLHTAEKRGEVPVP